ncbi:MAG: phenylalanine--tRNA ligase subunit alpha [Gammaproteobacteria bacterium]|nr:phenylalanine--tRNA ligase subunit alpha [Gammaproteobacteria bacterium]MCW5583578.1 phenylalanine--tRNA ligase subunit alpha [Gammaproteobacteria bacterium]
MQALEDVLQHATTTIQLVTDLKSLDNYRVQYLGKKGQLTEILKTLGQLPPDQRPAAGQKINAVKEKIQFLIEQRTIELQKAEIEKQLASESIDVTLPGRARGIGSIHPVTKTLEELRRIFSHMGFVFMEGPEIEEDYYNFTALNVPPLHPARAMQDTFYFNDNLVLRSQMSPVQIHAMKKMRPPLRMVAMGRVYRRDFDLTHTPMFHQMECLMVDEHVTFADLKGLLNQFLGEFFSVDTSVRFRPSYFPFTEPSAEVDIGCLSCKGKGCRICKHSGWLEVLGCGMVHPNVLAGVDIDSERYRGFAFGVGLDRLTLLKYGINDLRALFENDLRLLKQL